MFYVYILKSKKDKSLYTGYTSDLRERFKAHNTGEVESTKHRMPMELLYYEAYQKEKNARRREIQLKTISSQRESLKRRLYGSVE